MNDLNKMLESLNFSIKPTDESELIDSNEYKKLNISDSQKSQMSMFTGELPNLLASDILEKAYVVRFPDGLDHALAPLKNGGYMGAWRQASGQFGGIASLESLATVSNVMNAMSVLSVATGQYYLSNINDRLDKVNLQLDKILEFLYGDKRAELISEINFAQQIYKNYSSIMNHEEQRISTLIGLQSSRKVAVQDIEFYLSDLNQKAVRAKSVDDYNHIIKIKDCLDMSLQLYIISNILEIYVSQNLDKDYITSTTNTMITYIDACERQMLNKYSELNGKLAGLKPGLFKKDDSNGLKNELNRIVRSINTESNSPIKQQLKSINQFNEYAITPKGDVYARVLN